MKTNNTAFVYLFFNKEPNIIPANAPLMHSIACLKAHGDYKVYVLDCSPHNNDWHTWEAYLGFQTIKHSCRMNHASIKNLLVSNQTRAVLQVISRPWDIFDFANTINEQCIVHCDTDLFWISQPFPFEGNPEKLCCSWNTGLFYFNKQSDKVKKAVELWKAYISLAMTDKSFYNTLVNKFNDYQSLHLQEEMVFRYIQDALVELGLSEKLSEAENFSLCLENKKVIPYNYEPNFIKAIHLRNGPKDTICQDIFEINRLIKTVDTDGRLITQDPIIKIRHVINPLKF